MATYVMLLALYLLPMAVFLLLSTLTFAEFPAQIPQLRWLGITSPLLTLDSIPMTEVLSGESIEEAKLGSWRLVQAYFLTTLLLIIALGCGVMLLFRDRWRITGRN
jgi:hypothetical protein